MAHFNFYQLVSNLPDVLAKDKDSNNYKLLAIEEKIYTRIADILEDVQKCLNIDNCTGATLDMWGKRLKVVRGTATDKQFRLLIKAKIGQSFCDGTHGSIVAAIAYMLSCNPNQIKIASGSSGYAVRVIDIPMETIKKADFTPEQITQTIESLLPQGVRLEAVNYSGTFELGEEWGESDAEKGLSNLERTTGGYLGMARR